MKAYILIGTEVGRSAAVVRALRRMTGVVAADAVTGPYDVVAVVNAPDSNSVGRIVMNMIHTAQGVKQTLTCIAIESEEMA